MRHVARPAQVSEPSQIALDLNLRVFHRLHEPAECVSIREQTEKAHRFDSLFHEPMSHKVSHSFRKTRHLVSVSFITRENWEGG
jgi:hypothetical protein